MEVPVSFLAKISGYLPEGMRAELDRIMREFRCRHRENVRKCRDGHGDGHGENCDSQISKNGEIRSKTAFPAGKCDGHGDGHVSREGGVGGVVRRISTSTHYLNNHINQKEKENFSKNENQKKEFTSEEKKAYFDAIGRMAFPYWAVMPKESRRKSTFKKFLHVFNKIKADVPELHVFFGCLYNAASEWNDGYHPAADRFLESEPWIGIPAEQAASFERQKADFLRMAQIRIQRFNGEEK